MVFFLKNRFFNLKGSLWTFRNMKAQRAISSLAAAAHSAAASLLFGARIRRHVTATGHTAVVETVGKSHTF